MYVWFVVVLIEWLAAEIEIDYSKMLLFPLERESLIFWEQFSGILYCNLAVFPQSFMGINLVLRFLMKQTDLINCA